MGLFTRRTVGEPGEAVLINDSVGLARLDALIEKSYRMRSEGVSYELIERRALADGVPFNTALEALYKEKFNAETPVGIA